MDFRKQPEALVPILGQSFVNQLTDRKEHPALRIGDDVWNRHEVATRLGVVHTKACSILSHIAKKLDVKNTRDLYASTTPYSFADQPAGVTTMYVMFAAFRDRKLDVERWFAKGQEGAIVSFLRLKQRELEAERRTRKSEGRRQRQLSSRKHHGNVRGVFTQSRLTRHNNRRDDEGHNSEPTAPAAPGAGDYDQDA